MVVPRLLMAAIAAAAIFWSCTVYPKVRSERIVVDVTPHIIAGEFYKPEFMAALEASLDDNRASSMGAAVLSKTAVIRLRLVENAIASGDRRSIDLKLDKLKQAIDDALASVPSDPYLWLVLFWLDNARDGVKPEHLRYLKMSYALGAREGWIALKRNRLALEVYPALDADLAEQATTEFLGLISSSLYGEAGDILAGPGWPVRNILLTRLKSLSELDRRSFATALHNRDLDDVVVPGVDASPSRPWRR